MLWNNIYCGKQGFLHLPDLSLFFYVLDWYLNTNQQRVITAVCLSARDRCFISCYFAIIITFPCRYNSELTYLSFRVERRCRLHRLIWILCRQKEPDKHQGGFTRCRLGWIWEFYLSSSAAFSKTILVIIISVLNIGDVFIHVTLR